MSYYQAWPPRDEHGAFPDGGADLPVDTHVFQIPISGFPRGTYGYSMTSAPAAPAAASITIHELFRPSGFTAADWHRIPSLGDLSIPGSATLGSYSTFGRRATVALRFTIVVFEVLPGFALYANRGRQGDLR